MEPTIFVCKEINAKTKGLLFHRSLKDKHLVYIPQELTECKLPIIFDLTETTTITQETMQEALWHLINYEPTILVVGEFKNIDVFKGAEVFGDIKCEVIQIPSLIDENLKKLRGSLYIPRANGKLIQIKRSRLVA